MILLIKKLDHFLSHKIQNFFFFSVFQKDRSSNREKLKNESVCVKTCQEVTGISRATYYRRKRILNRLLRGIAPPSKKPKRLNKFRWGEVQNQLVLTLRRANPTYGKEKIAIILRRDHGQTLSESTLGRILSFLKGRGPMVNSLVYSAATSNSAKKFLKELIEKAPFKIQSIQVDGGSEFMGEFEKACQERDIPLIVLPPKKPTYNGGVERGNRTPRRVLCTSLALI